MTRLRNRWQRTRDLRPRVLGYVVALSVAGWLVAGVVAFPKLRFYSAKPISWRSTETSFTKFTFTKAPQSDNNNPRVAEIEVERIAVTTNGFEPSEIQRPAGKFLLAIDNRAKPAEFSFELYRLSGQKLNLSPIRQGQRRQQQILDLEPGNYVLSETHHPNWGCQFVISAR